MAGRALSPLAGWLEPGTPEGAGTGERAADAESDDLEFKRPCRLADRTTSWGAAETT
jgi:hypothetical protein